MIVRNPAEIKLLIKSGQGVLGIDLGSKTIGLARSDLSLTFASPLKTLRRTKFSGDAIRLIELIAHEEIGALILGLPINMDGSEGRRCQSTRQFAENFLAMIDIPIVFWDERLSTQAVRRTLIEANASRKRQAEAIDKMAAAYILQGALDAMSNAIPTQPSKLI
jgi:putative Holliday junction resolvase